MKFIVLALIMYLFGAVTQYFFVEKQKVNYLIVVNTIATLLAISGALGCFVSQSYNQDLMFEFGNTLVNVVLSLDGLSAFFVLIIAFISWLAIIYSKGYLAKYVEAGKSVHSHYFVFNIFIITMMFVVLSQNVFAFLIAWEIMSFSSFLLILFDTDQQDVRKSAIRYFVTMHIGVLLLMAGFIMLNIKTGSIWFFDYNGEVNPLIYFLFFTGFGIKAGLFPVNTWLSRVHSTTPSHVSALVSGVMITIGIYGIIRMTQLLNSPTTNVGYTVLTVGLVTALCAILYSIGQKDIKKMLACSSAWNMGIITIALGLGLLGIAYHNVGLKSLGFIGCFMHILNHAIFTPLMFFASGAIYNKTQTKDMEKLGGLAKIMPKTALCFLFGSLAVCALPPFNGFVSQYLIYDGFINSFNTLNELLVPVMIIAMAIMAFVGAMAIVILTSSYGTIFLGNPRTDLVKNVKEDVPQTMTLPMFILVGLVVLIGLFPQCSVLLVGGATSELILFLYPAGFLTVISFFNITLLLTIGALLLVRKALLKGKSTTKRSVPECDCLDKPFLCRLNSFYINVMESNNIEEFSKEKTPFFSKVCENCIINPLEKFDEKVLSKFSNAQSGDYRMYILYSVIAIVVAICLVLGGNI